MRGSRSNAAICLICAHVCVGAHVCPPVQPFVCKAMSWNPVCPQPTTHAETRNGSARGGGARTSNVERRTSNVERRGVERTYLIISLPACEFPAFNENSHGFPFSINVLKSLLIGLLFGLKVSFPPYLRACMARVRACVQTDLELSVQPYVWIQSMCLCALVRECVRMFTEFAGFVVCLFERERGWATYMPASMSAIRYGPAPCHAAGILARSAGTHQLVQLPK